ncbi:MAG: hypothetical protein IPH96_01000 [Saprospiraceae bacterium]|nr:hypothetical protein [Saprospiraceae bacterium]
MEIDLAAAKTKAEEAAKAKDIFWLYTGEIGLVECDCWYQRTWPRKSNYQQLGYVQQSNTVRNIF